MWRGNGHGHGKGHGQSLGHSIGHSLGHGHAVFISATTWKVKDQSQGPHGSPTPLGYVPFSSIHV